MSEVPAESGSLEWIPQYPLPLAIRARKTTPMVSRSAQEAQAGRAAGRRKSAISQRSWNMHKAEIERLFLSEGKTLQEIMSTMVQVHDFHASKKMYKTQMKSWKFGKYLRKEELSWMYWKAEQRRQEEAKDTEFLYRGQKYTSTMVQQRLERRRIQRPPTPPTDVKTPYGLDYATPTDVSASPVLAGSQHLSDSTEESEESRSGRASSLAQEAPDSHAQVWYGHTTESLLRVRHQAEMCEHDGEIQLAERYYCEALSGLESLLSGVHDDTIATAYHLATFYARRGYMKDADLVLDRVTTSHLEQFSSIHPRTAKHLFHVMNFFEEWSRPEERDVFALRMFESLSDHARAACTRLGLTQGHDEQTTPAEIDRQLDRLKLRAESELHNAQTFIRDLIEICDADIIRMGEQGLRCRVQLILILHQRYTGAGHRLRLIGDKDLAMTRELSQVLISSEAFLKRLWQSDIKVTVSLIGSSIQVARWLVKLHHYDQADCTLNVIAHHASQLFTDSRDSKGLIEVLVYIGILYQSEGRWDDARPHFEHALRVCSQTGEHEGVLALLEEAIRERIFPASKLPSAFKPVFVPW